MTLNILFTSAGRRVELLRAFKKALGEIGLGGNIVAIDTDPLAPALQVADSVHIVPNMHSPEYVPKLMDICRHDSVNIIFPLIDPDIPVLAAHISDLESVGVNAAVVDLEAALLVGDKQKTGKFFQELGLTVPRSWLAYADLPDEYDFPVFIKPAHGSAAAGTYKVEDKKQLEFFSDYVEGAIVQEYLPGPEITMDVTCDLESKVLAVVCRQRIEVRWGEVQKGVTIHNQELIEACALIASKLPARGPITVQCIMKNGIPHFTEINARLGGGVPLGFAAGVEAPMWLLASIAGKPVEIPPLGTYEAGIYMTRYDDSYFLTRGQNEGMARHSF